MGLGQRSSHLPKPNRFSGFLLPQCYQAVLGVNFHFPVCPVFEWHLLEFVVLLPYSRHEPANGIIKFQLLENKCNIKKSINTRLILLRVIKIIFTIAFSRFASTCLAICCLRNVCDTHWLCMYFALGLSSSIHYLSFVVGFASTTLSCNHYFIARICTDNQHYDTLIVCLKRVISRRGPWDTGELKVVFTLYSKLRVRDSWLKIQTSSNSKYCRKQSHDCNCYT